jgi:hypothetical protein
MKGDRSTDQPIDRSAEQPINPNGPTADQAFGCSDD